MMVASLSLKNAWLPKISFGIPITLAKLYFIPIVITFAKNTSLLGGTVLKFCQKLRAIFGDL